MWQGGVRVLLSVFPLANADFVTDANDAQVICLIFQSHRFCTVKDFDVSTVRYLFKYLVSYLLNVGKARLLHNSYFLTAGVRLSLL